MKGSYKGKYWYKGEVNAPLANRITEFELSIESYSNSRITGSISDNLETGGTKGIGSLTGKVKGSKLRFVKRMPIRTAVDKDGNRIEENKPHKPIYYEGEIDERSGLIKGSWKLKGRIGFIQGRIAIYKTTKGEWEMRKV